MSISSINPAAAAQAAAALSKPAPDGDSPAVEAAESAATKAAEKNNGGFAPNPTTPGGVDTVV